MKYISLPQQLLIKNRKKLTDWLDKKSLAIFNSNDIYPISADSTFPFHQHRDIFYLSGIDQEESILLLFPDAFHEAHREILFLKETNDHIVIWEGPKLTKEQARQCSGVQTVYWLNEFEGILYKLMTEAEKIYLNLIEHYRPTCEVQTREDRFIERIQRQYPLHEYKRSNPILQCLRSIKSPEEITLIQTACDITEKGFRQVLNFIKPGVWEYEIEAEWIHEFLRNRANGFAYTPIIASGYSACILHYIENNKLCQDGELLLMDVGACYANYSADLTRTIPVNGCYTERQNQIYDAVLRIKEQAAEMLVPGNDWYAYHKEVGQIMTAELIDLGLLDRADVQNEDPQQPVYKKYFMHGTSHHLGLDTHDYGILSEPFQAGMVFTVEPGIYIPREGLGIRIEDDYVIQKSGAPFNLMKDIPILADEIETLMHSKP
ncbi:MAG: aminopeptidase P N-terminal domain-containing protein [Flavobacteriales bacterium AspAUS03]